MSIFRQHCPARWAGRGGPWPLASGLCLLLAGCVDYLDPGQLGQLRYFGDVRGEVPLRFSAPVADRDGNTYVLFGSPEVAEAIAFIGHAGGDWSGNCLVHENATRGTHGWIGRAQRRAWYWSGDSLVEVSGGTGGCRELLDQDPRTAADLAFVGVLPWVKETPSRTSTVALIQSPSDPVPFFVTVDLDQGVYTNLSEFVPRGADDVTVLGVGARPSDDSGVMVLKYTLGDDVRVEGRFVADDATVGAIANLSGLDDVPLDGFAGFLQVTADGVAVGVLQTGEVVAFDGERGGVRASGGLEPVGVHLWNDEVWVVGIGNGRPAVARVGAGGVLQAPQVWAASEHVATSLRGAQLVLDDRVKPVQTMSWTDPVAAVGPFPFVQAHSVHPYAEGTTLLLVAGPGYVAAGEPFTSVAVAPVGVSFP